MWRGPCRSAVPAVPGAVPASPPPPRSPRRGRRSVASAGFPAGPRGSRRPQLSLAVGHNKGPRRAARAARPARRSRGRRSGGRGGAGAAGHAGFSACNRFPPGAGLFPPRLPSFPKRAGLCPSHPCALRSGRCRAARCPVPCRCRRSGQPVGARCPRWHGAVPPGPALGGGRGSAGRAARGFMGTIWDAFTLQYAEPASALECPCQFLWFTIAFYHLKVPFSTKDLLRQKRLIRQCRWHLLDRSSTEIHTECWQLQERVFL